MSSIGDSSQISDLSGISRISRSSGIIRPSIKVDSAFVMSECQASSTIREPINRSTLGGPVVSISKVSQIVKLMNRCEDATCNYAKLKLFHDCLRQVAQSNDSSINKNNVSERLNSILATHQASKYLQLPNMEKNNLGDLRLLGIAELPKYNLTRNEKRDVCANLESILWDKMNNFIDRYENSGGNIAEVLKNHESAGQASLLESHETDLLRWNESMNEICTRYYQDLLACADLLCQWQRLKYIEMRELNIKNAENLMLQAQVAEVQANISRMTCASRMFNETPTTVDAFGILSKNLDDRILDMREKIKKKEILRMTYADVSSTEYDHLLKKYTELCGVIRKKEHLMEML